MRTRPPDHRGGSFGNGFGDSHLDKKIPQEIPLKVASSVFPSPPPQLIRTCVSFSGFSMHDSASLIKEANLSVSIIVLKKVRLSFTSAHVKELGKIMPRN